jgi:hypothetical protein
MGTSAVAQHGLAARVVLLGAPLALAVLEVFHPRREDAAGAIAESEWFFWFHMIQLPLVGLVALSVYLLTQGLASRLAAFARWSVAVFAVFFSAYDAAAGIATGYVLRNARGMPAESQAAVFKAAHDMPGVSMIFVLSMVGTAAWVVAMVTAALALRRAGGSRITLVLLVMAGVFLLAGHPFPFGTLAFACLFGATVVQEFLPGARAEGASPPPLVRT